MSRDELSISDGVDASASQDAEVARVLDLYLAELEAGRAADPGQLLAEHPAIAEQLRACLEVMQLAERVADGSGAARGQGPDAAVLPLASSLLSTWNFGNGPPPRIHLHDLADDEPLMRPGSPEMPATPEGHCGRYQLQGEIARGGMGAILRGRDVDLGRDLAIKVLLEAQRDNPDVVRRFVEEAQIGGQLQHPGIVPVYELGACADRRPYFTMKLIRGRTLSALLQDRTGPHHDLPRFLSIFEQIVQTMAYAHARGVIHRDLKPSNVMVGSFGEVQVMDWGLAKVLAQGGMADEPRADEDDEAALLTVRSGPAGSGCESQVGSVLGTPSYMAPEQARGDLARLDERADVFGLGAILCEILTGRPPFTGSTREEIRARAERCDLADALDRLDATGADTELIGLARDCLAAEPERRPRTAGAVAGRMRAYLAGVQDRLKAAEQARIEARARLAEERKRRWFVMASAAAILVMAGLAGATWLRVAQARATRNAMAAQALTDARRLRDWARNGPLLDVIRLGEAIAAAERAGAAMGGEGDPAQQRGVQSLLDDLRRERQEAEQDRDMLARLAEIRGSEGEELMDLLAADSDYARAFRDYGIAVEGSPADVSAARILARPRAVAVALGAALDDWASLRRRQSREPAPVARLVELARLVDADPYRNTLRAVLGRPDRRASRSLLKQLANDRPQLDALPVTSLILLSRALAEIGEANLVVHLLRTARQRFPGDVWINFDLARALQQAHPARAGEAIRYFTAAQSLRPETAHLLAHALQAEGQHDEAIAVFRGLVRISPSNGHHHLCLGYALKENGATQESTAALNRAIAECRATLALVPNDGATHNILGLALAGTGALDEAIAEYRTVLRLDPNFAVVHLSLGNSLKERRSLDEAIAEYRTALRSNPTSAEAHLNLGEALHDKGRSREAFAEYQTALLLKPDYADAHSSLGIALKHQGKILEAIKEYRIALRLNPDYADAHNNLADALSGQGKRDQAIAEYRAALHLNPGSFKAHCNLGKALYDKGQYAGAIAEFHAALRLRPEYVSMEDYVRRTDACWALLSLTVGELDPLVRGSRPLTFSPKGKSLAFFVVPYHAILYLRPVGGTAGAVTEFGLGTSEAEHTPIFTGLPADPKPDDEVKIGFVAAGSGLPFYVKSESRRVRWVFSQDASFYEKTEWNGIRWGFSHDTKSDAARVAFQDLDNSLGRNGSIIEQTGPSTWLLHLDDAGSAEFDDNDADVLIQIRLVPAGPGLPRK